jgi:hypothetical protein
MIEKFYLILLLWQIAVLIKIILVYYNNNIKIKTEGLFVSNEALSID